MNISFCLAVYNKLDLTIECYNHIRTMYPNIPFVISSCGSIDGTNEWLESLNDKNLIYHIDKEKKTFSENFNIAIKLVQTEKLVIIHNDMVIGKYFLENIDKSLTEDILLSYTTIEPSIYSNHIRPGKVILNLGDSFENFNHTLFNEYVQLNKDNCELYDGGVFFMSGYKKLFEDVGYFDEFSFFPAFCEDDDFLIRTKLKGYKLKTTPCSIVYHFVSRTSRFSDDFINEKQQNEINSNRNFIRKWGIPIKFFHEIPYWSVNDFSYKKYKIGLKKNNFNNVPDIEPYFDKILIKNGYDISYLRLEQTKTNYNLKSKFESLDDCDVIIESIDEINQSDFDLISKLQLVLPNYNKGTYKFNNLLINIR